MTEVLVLHAYSANNAGDGLLVHETLALIADAVGAEAQITIAASHPETFRGLDSRIVDSKPGKTGYSREYRQLLRSLDRFDLVVGVGGGYLRAGHASEMLKAAVIHGPQLTAASRTSTPTVYMPQSVGPASGLVKRLLKRKLSGIDTFYVRDDRSVVDYSAAGVTRASDLAILTAPPIERHSLTVDPIPVVTVRAIRGRIAPLVAEFARQCGPFDGYVQSDTAGNNDVDAMKSLDPRRIVGRKELMTPDSGESVRVVIAVRLHAALMALRAGHFVVHLAYERKGFGAFGDLGLGAYVHNINKFEPARVAAQMQHLLTDEETRRQYAQTVDTAFAAAASGRSRLVDELRRAANFSPEGSR
ncbi:polysaccharide pyruvyl transferase family protein [Rhodococcus sp. 15-649-1-2]|uniref:polysaccharide pyruvyl transferase family protein n=1 Tax=Rhodococcus sp. 114MFTsu3.1 TaxID=1172184 RepID=UPI000370EC7F|nr:MULTISPECIES: polysaccharide pyruvyl transferase family protein [unclassified Rhodococcus (in: high G+C Gram-positive bacteria)]OZE84924.1 polysaccharide pyruvyl transferase family protein [Rhodococcus sp. 15-649-1-2]